MPTPQHEPNVPMPYTTKQAAKKKTKMGKRGGTRQPNPIALIYQKETYATVADEATEARLNRTKYTAPHTSTRLAGYNFIWGELPETPTTPTNP